MMYSATKDENRICGYSDNSLGRFLLREKLIDHLREEGDLSDEELAIAAKYFPELLVYNMNPDSRAVLAYVKEGNPLSRDTFPERVWEDREVLYQAFCNKRHLPSAAHKRVDELLIKRFLEEHSDQEIISFLQERSYLKNKVKHLIKDEALLSRIDETNRKTIEYEDEPKTSLLEETFLSSSFEKVDFSGNIELLEKKLPAPRKEAFDMRAYKDAVYPRIIHYISDLHLTHKIKEKIEKGLSHKEAINRVVKKAVRDIEKSISECENNLNRSWESQVLLIGGDVSFDFNISKIFYKTLASSLVIKKKNVYAILGNHELWGGNPDIITNQGCDEIIEKYRLLFEECGITFLENQVAVVVSDNSFDIERYVLAVDFILNKDNQDAIERLIEKSRYVICGGIAFSGNNERFNVRNGIYRNAVNSREDEIRRSQKYDLLLRKVSELAKDRPIISLTHMPKEDWLQEADYDNCIYISGHTHKNIRSEEDIKVYADNQVGYKCNRYLTKQFIIDAKYDIFESYPDGVHSIERVDYSEFGKGIGLYLSFRHDPNSQMYLLKRDGIYMFVSESKNGLSILSGGRRKRLSRKDLNYYYANMSTYAELLKTSFEGYEKYINDVSNIIKRLGGSGRIHGCIVDVDFFNHIYVNPYDGTVTCYYAEDVNSRLVFSNLTDMLETNISNSEVLDEIKNKFLQVGDNNNLLAPNVNLLNFGSHYISTGTYLYRPSERVNKIHRLFNYRVLQIWDESVDGIQIGEGTRNEIKTYALPEG